MRERRFIVAPADLAEGRAVVRGDEHHHLAKVLRLAAGDEVRVFDGQGRAFRGVIDAIARDRAEVRLLEEEKSSEPTLRVTLLAGLLHGERMDWTIEKATEIGVARIVPVLGERAVAKPRKGGWGRPDRWRRIALAASKQSGRSVLPEIAEPAGFAEALALSASSGAERIIFHPGAEGLPPRPDPGLRESHVLVGPEGGWSAAEVDRAIEAGFVPAGLGNLTLRAETAALAALALVILRRGRPF